MKRQFLLLVGCLLAFTYVTAQSPIGTWKTIDDETGNEKSYVEIYEQNGKLYGKVTQLLLPEDQGKSCEDCKGKKKDQPIEGMEILMGMEVVKDYWDNGKILDPKNGKVYSCYMELESADKLKVRGFLGISLLGRTQYWYRMK